MKERQHASSRSASIQQASGWVALPVLPLLPSHPLPPAHPHRQPTVTALILPHASSSPAMLSGSALQAVPHRQDSADDRTFILRSASCSFEDWPRLERKESISSTKMTEGESLWARPNRALRTSRQEQRGRAG